MDIRTAANGDWIAQILDLAPRIGEHQPRGKAGPFGSPDRAKLTQTGKGLPAAMLILGSVRALCSPKGEAAT
jgi:hypothetical protein